MRRVALTLTFALGASGATGFAACSSEDPAGAPPQGDAGTSGPDVDQPTDAGGGDAEAGAPLVLFKSGTRLKIERVRADGEDFFRRFVDAKLGAVCNLTRTSATTAVCIPEAETLVYADSTCTTRAALAPSCTRVKYAADFQHECGFVTNVVTHPLGAPIAGDTFYVKTPACTAQVGGGSVLSVGAQIPMSDLVSFTAKLEAGSAELGRVRWTASDGAEWVDDQRLFDVKHAAQCQGASVGLATTGAGVRCVPPLRAVHRGGGDGPFTDSNCMTPAANWGFTNACGKPEIALRRTPVPDAGACNSFYFSLAQVGAEVASGYLQQGASCNLDTTTSSSTWALGAALPDSTYPELVLANHGSGRVRARAYTSNGVRLVNGRPFDTASGGTCYEQKIGNDYYCVTEIGAIGASYFADAACTIPAVLGASSCAGAEPPQPQAAVSATADPNGCDSVVTEVRAVSLLAGATQVYSMSGGPCEALPISGKAYAVGGPVDPATIFPKLTIVTE